MAHMKGKWLAIAFFAALLGATHARTPEQAKSLHQAWAEATMHADVAALKHILADDLTYTHTGGNTQTKDEFISSLREKKDSVQLQRVRRCERPRLRKHCRDRQPCACEGHGRRTQPQFDPPLARP